MVGEGRELADCLLTRQFSIVFGEVLIIREAEGQDN
jgi:hypothetical protein